MLLALEVESRFLRLLAGACVVAALWQAARLSMADYKQRRGEIHEALAADPGNAAYLAAAGRYEEAARISPMDADLWIARGLEREAARDYDEAERSLLEAAAVSRKYAPRWTLANYYFRRGRPEEFWRWTRAAFEMAYGDRTPLFDLCWAMTSDGDEIVERAIPEDNELRRIYLGYLCGRRRWSAAARLAADFRRRGIAPAGTPFSWQAGAPAGVTVTPLPDGWRFTLDGTQPEHCELLWMLAPVPESGRLTLRARHAASLTTPEGVPGSTGLHWRASTLDGESLAASGADELSLAGEQEIRATFDVSRSADAARIALAYDKQPGSMRPEGTLQVQEIEVSAAP